MDNSLVERAQRGDRDAYEALARASVRRLFAVASRILRDPDAAEDAVQQTLVVMWRDIGGLRDPERFEAWTYRMVIRQCQTEARRRRRMTGRIVDLSDELAGTTDDLRAVAVRDQLDRAFGSLSTDHRAVLVLHHVVGLPTAEIAAILGVPVGTVGSRLHQARQAMRAAIEADDRVTVHEGHPA